MSHKTQMSHKTKIADHKEQQPIQNGEPRREAQEIRSSRDHSIANKFDADKRRRSRLYASVCTLAIASASLFPPAIQSQSAANQPGSPIDITTKDLEANEIQNNWLSYYGDFTGRRYSSLKQINHDNIHQLELKWVFHSRKVRVLGSPPVVVGGVMYLTASNDLFAIDGLTGAVLWHRTQEEAADALEDESAQINRGVAVLSNRLYMQTDEDHLLSLDARSGNVIWDVPFSEGHIGYGGVSVPLVVRDMVIVSKSAGKEIQQGFVAAFDATTGKQIWKFALEPAHDGSSSLKGDPLEIRNESWMPATYDPSLDLIFVEMSTQPCNSVEDAQPDEVQHGGCLVALDSSTGKLKWQSPLPSNELPGAAISAVPVLVDAPNQVPNQGAIRKLIVAAQSNGFLTIFDRATGELLTQMNLDAMQAFAKTSHLQSPEKAESTAHPSTPENTCPAKASSPSWNPPAYSEQTHIFYLMRFVDCHAKSANRSALLWYDPVADTLVMQDASAVSSDAPSGVLATASGLLLFGGKEKSFQALDALTGKALWSFPMGQSATGPAISYAIGDSQYISIAAGNDLLVFGLP